MADVAAFAMNPLAGLVSWGVGWLLDHIEPLKSWLNELAGNAGAVQGGSATWVNIAAGLEAAAADLTRSLDGTLADARSRATDAYKALMGDVGAHVRMASELAEAIGTGLSVASGIVQFVHDLVRDAISDVVGYAVSCIIPLPNVIASVVAKVWSWVDRIVTKLRDLVRSFSRLDGLFRRVDDLLERLKAVLDRIKHGVLGDHVSGPNPRSRTPNSDELADGPQRRASGDRDIGSESGVRAALSRDDLHPDQLTNLVRYLRKMPAGTDDTVITRGAGDVVQFSTRVPGRVPGSYATYTKVVDSSGITIGYTKTTVAPDGTVVHVKDKMLP